MAIGLNLIGKLYTAMAGSRIFSPVGKCRKYENIYVYSTNIFYSAPTRPSRTQYRNIIVNATIFTLHITFREHACARHDVVSRLVGFVDGDNRVPDTKNNTQTCA